MLRRPLRNLHLFTPITGRVTFDALEKGNNAFFWSKRSHLGLKSSGQECVRAHSQRCAVVRWCLVDRGENRARFSFSRCRVCLHVADYCYYFPSTAVDVYAVSLITFHTLFTARDSFTSLFFV
jgi:hypothetical protein